MGKYTADDNRSMQLNPNNERYYSSRGENHDDWTYDYDDYETEAPPTTQGSMPMLLEINGQILNFSRITTIKFVPCGFDIIEHGIIGQNWDNDDIFGNSVNVRYDIIFHTDFNESFTINVQSEPTMSNELRTNLLSPDKYDFLPEYRPSSEIKFHSVFYTYDEYDQDDKPTNEQIQTALDAGINTWVRKFVKDMISHQQSLIQ